MDLEHTTEHERPEVDVIVRTSNGGVHRLAHAGKPGRERTFTAEQLAEMVSEDEHPGFVQDEEGRWVNLTHVVEAWDVPCGANLYAGLRV